LFAASFSLLLVFASTRTSTASTFTDVPGDDPARASIAYLEEEGIAGGFEDGSFHPGDPVNRAEFLRVVIASADSTERAAACIRDFQAQYGNAQLFRDVSQDAWFRDSLCRGLALKIIERGKTRMFRPADNVNFAEAAKMIAMAFKLPVNVVEGPWYRAFVEALAAKNAIPTDITSFTKPLTRRQMAVMIHRLRASIDSQPSLTYETIGVHLAAPMKEKDGTLLLGLINAERTKNGLMPYAWNGLLASAAIRHAQDMETRQYYSHFSPEGLSALDRIRATGYLNVDPATCNCTRWVTRYGENIFRGSENAGEVFAVWIGSPVHRANLLTKNFREAAIVRSGQYWVMTFGAIETQ
jgi:uncharacterized protein YkwD